MSGACDAAQSLQLPHQKSPSDCSNIPVGSAVEVEAHEEEFNGVYYSATVIESRKKRSKKVYVEYRDLLAEEGGSDRLREFVNESSVRPEPPVLEIAKGFEVGDVVDALYKDGWWTGVVSRSADGGNFTVTFPHPYEELEFGLADLRAHLDWVNGQWLRPQKRDPPNPTNTIDVVEGHEAVNKRKACLSGELSKSLKKRKEGNKKDKDGHHGLDPASFANIEKSLSQSNHQLQQGKRRTSRTTPIRRKINSTASSPGKSKPKTFPLESLKLDSGETEFPAKIGSSVSGGQVSPLSDKKNISSVDGQRLQGNNSSSSKKIKECDQSGAGGVSDKRNRGIPMKTLFEGLVPGYLKCTAAGDNQRDGVVLKEAASEKHLESERRETAQTEPKNLPNANRTISVVLGEGTQKQSAKTESLIDKVSVAATEPHEALATALVDKSKPQNSVVDIVLMEDNENRPENAVDKAATIPSENEAQNFVRKAVEVVFDEAPPSVDNVAIVSSDPENLPFVKNCTFWKTLESMEVFRRMPQTPHFQPLESVSETSRQGLAIGLMVTFFDLVERTSKLQISDPISIMNDLTASLTELEKHGFDVGTVKNTINELLVMKEREEKLLDDVGSVDNQLREHRCETSRIEKERDEIMVHITRLQTRLSLTDSAKVKEEEEIASLQVRLREFNESIDNLRSTFEDAVSKVMLF